MNGIIVATLTVGIIGLILGITLNLASEKFKVPVNEKEQQIRRLLPGNNCGACGYPGCDGLAEAIVNNRASNSQCPIGGQDVALKIAEIMGQVADEIKHEVAKVKCAGTCDKIKIQCYYDGDHDCLSSTLTQGSGDKSCQYGCLGYGSCVKACPFNAIEIIDGVAVVDKEKCRGCKKCIDICPKNLIEMVPYDALYHVSCNNIDKGVKVNQVCTIGCIGCSLCTKVCPVNAIKIENFLAQIDYNICINCGKCVEKCPRKIIKR